MAWRYYYKGIRSGDSPEVRWRSFAALRMTAWGCVILSACVQPTCLTWPCGLLGNHQDKITDESSDGIATMDRAHKQFVQDRMLQSYTFLLCNNRLIRRLWH